MNNKTYKTCNTCFFTERFPGITVSDNGSCNLCNDNSFRKAKENQTNSTQDELKKIAEIIRKESRGKYDCIVGASGGLDSSYAVYVAKKIMNLNPLVVSYDHNFSYDVAKDNLKAMCKSLGVDLKIIKSKARNDLKYVKYMVLALRNVGLYWGVCNFCH